MLDCILIEGLKSGIFCKKTRGGSWQGPLLSEVLLKKVELSNDRAM
jgi:hypothetical protein